MTSILVAGPAVEPLSVAETKSYLRLDHADDDALIATLIAAARSHIESVTRKAMITQRWKWVSDVWPGHGITLPIAPFQALESISLFDDPGTETIWPLAEVKQNKQSGKCTVFLAPTSTSVPRLRDYDAVEITYRTGFGDAAGNVPEDLRLAMLRLIGHWYEHREAVVTAGSGAVIPTQFDLLISKYCEVRL
ncbi:head-tail connector protein [Maritalea mediterranea]|uniref:Head-tail connector protein n=1 Tax=Maritalea mediterranea TaxID=2909667 RepID=A0ABS9E7Q1_9HYPH|nr:head-tail connector protein [Maritalea mediterranea]MCF4097934.1 head-tail connector protein [Maritalea mediterranea]